MCDLERFSKIQSHIIILPNLTCDCVWLYALYSLHGYHSMASATGMANTWSSFVSMHNYIDIMYIKTHDSESRGQEEAAV